MAPVGTLWGRPGQRQTKVILSVAALNGFGLAQPEWSFYNKPAEFTAKFPYGKIPTFEGTDGFKLSEGAAIARYLSSIGTVDLLGSNVQEVALVDQWMRFAEQEIGIPAGIIMGTIYGYLAPFNLELTLADFVLAGVIFGATCDARVTSDEKVKQYWGTEQFVDVRITESKPHELITRMYDGESRENIGG
ncbi:glutathione S-transferase C-terminal-like protein [Chiua virens]|nr:glutathione S-transferase C-terminal-like protein [Chiua virens]